MTTAIYFDLDGTILPFEQPYEDVVAAVLEGVVPDPEACAHTFLAVFNRSFEQLTDAPYRAGMSAVADATDATPDPDELVDRLRDAECSATRVSDPARESLQALAAENDLGILTNGVGEFQRAKLVHHDLCEHFETVIVSAEVGAHKPDPAMFERAKTAIDADRYVMVGDDYEADVQGARAAGFTPIHVERGEGVPDFWATLRAMI